MPHVRRDPVQVGVEVILARHVASMQEALLRQMVKHRTYLTFVPAEPLCGMTRA